MSRAPSSLSTIGTETMCRRLFLRWMLAGVFLPLIIHAETSITCSYAGGFQKGLQDFQSGAYGANPDKYCYGLKQEDRDSFLHAYDEGRDHAYLFQKVKMTSVPKSTEEFQSLLKEARALQVQIDKQAATSTTTIEERLKALESENKNLKEQINTLKGFTPIPAESPSADSPTPTQTLTNP